MATNKRARQTKGANKTGEQRAQIGCKLAFSSRRGPSFSLFFSFFSYKMFIVRPRQRRRRTANAPKSGRRPYHHWHILDSLVKSQFAQSASSSSSSKSGGTNANATKHEHTNRNRPNEFSSSWPTLSFSPPPHRGPSGCDAPSKRQLDFLLLLILVQLAEELRAGGLAATQLMRANGHWPREPPGRIEHCTIIIGNEFQARISSYREEEENKMQEPLAWRTSRDG